MHRNRKYISNFHGGGSGCAGGYGISFAREENVLEFLLRILQNCENTTTHLTIHSKELHFMACKVI